NIEGVEMRRYFMLLVLYSRVLRNCELANDISVKRNALSKCIKRYCDLIYYSYNIVKSEVASLNEHKAEIIKNIKERNDERDAEKIFQEMIIDLPRLLEISVPLAVQ